MLLEGRGRRFSGELDVGCHYTLVENYRCGGGGHNQKLLNRQAHRQTRRGAIESQHNNRLRSDVCSGMVSQEPSCLDASFAASVGAESSSGAGSQTWRTSQ